MLVIILSVTLFRLFKPLKADAFTACPSSGVFYGSVASTFYIGGDTYFSRNTAEADGGEKR